MQIAIPFPKDHKIGIQIYQKSSKYKVDFDISSDGEYILISLKDYVRFHYLIFGTPMETKLIVSENRKVFPDRERLRVIFIGTERTIKNGDLIEPVETDIYNLIYGHFSIRMICYSDEGEYNYIAGVMGPQDAINVFGI